MKKVLSVMAVVVFSFSIISACAPIHRVVKAKAVRESNKPVTYFYGVTYNNVLIPDYTQSASGEYAPSYDEAWSLYEKRRGELDPWMPDKYELTNSAWFHFSNAISRLSLLAISPLIIPIEWVGEKLAPDPDLAGKRGRSLKEITRDFFETQYDMPVLKNPNSVK